MCLYPIIRDAKACVSPVDLSCGTALRQTLSPSSDLHLAIAVPSSTSTLANYSGWYNLDACESTSNIIVQYCGVEYELSRSCTAFDSDDGTTVLAHLQVPRPIVAGDTIYIGVRVPDSAGSVEAQLRLTCKNPICTAPPPTRTAANTCSRDRQLATYPSWDIADTVNKTAGEGLLDLVLRYVTV